MPTPNTLLDIMLQHYGIEVVTVLNAGEAIEKKRDRMEAVRVAEGEAPHPNERGG